MTATITAQTPARLVFDKDGDVNQRTMDDLVDAIRTAAVTDLFIFSHGWNNDEAAATSLYKRWFALLAAQVKPGRNVGYVGIRWPAQLWRDEPIPRVSRRARSRSSRSRRPGREPGDRGWRAHHRSGRTGRPEGHVPHGQQGELDAIASACLRSRRHPKRRPNCSLPCGSSARRSASSSNDGEADPSKEPGMLDEDRLPVDVFTKFADGLSQAGVDFGDGGGEAGLGDFGAKLLHGAKEALRRTHLLADEEPRRRGRGQKGLGPAIDRLTGEFPKLRIHLIGHSFGARLVSFALAGIRESEPSPVKSVTLLEGAYSRFAFTHDLPFGGHGALDGKLARIDGPLTVCFSSHDRALSVFYPLASAAAGDDSAGADDPLARWRAMGSLGAFNVASRMLGDVGTSYPFQAAEILNLDSSDVVVAGDSPSGAHSDIFHAELAWVAASAGGLSTR